MTKGYVFGHMKVTDPAVYETYRAGVLDTIKAHGGRFLVRGAPPEPREGGTAWNRVVILEFPSLAAARGWYDSPEYQKLAKIRQSASSGDLILLEGAPPL